MGGPRTIMTGGIRIEREEGPLPSLNYWQKWFLIEERSAFQLTVEPSQPVPFYTIVAIVCDLSNSLPKFRGESISSLFAGSSSPTIFFFFFVVASLDKLFHSWDRVLQAVDEELKAPV